MATHTCNGDRPPVFGRRTSGCPRCEELANGAQTRSWFRTTGEQSAEYRRRKESEAAPRVMEHAEGGWAVLDPTAETLTMTSCHATKAAADLAAKTPPRVVLGGEGLVKTFDKATLDLIGRDPMAYPDAVRLQPVLIRYRPIQGTAAVEGRCTAPAQDASHLIEVLEATDHYIRDIQQIGGAR